MDILENLKSNVLYPQDLDKALSVGLAVAMLGNFRFELPSIKLLKYQLSKYTYNQEEIINGYVKQTGGITLKAYREITEQSTYVFNIVSNELILKLFEKYSDQGGLFTLITPVGLISNLFLDDLEINFNGANPVFQLKFTKLIVSTGSKNKKSTRAAVCL